MSSSDQLAARKSAETRLLRRALREPDVRAALCAAPRKTIAAILGIDIPPSIQVRIVEEKTDEICIVLPASPSSTNASEPLSLDDLDAVAGGFRRSLDAEW